MFRFFLHNWIDIKFYKLQVPEELLNIIAEH